MLGLHPRQRRSHVLLTLFRCNDRISHFIKREGGGGGGGDLTRNVLAELSFFMVFFLLFFSFLLG